MSNRSLPPGQRSRKKGGKVIPALFNLVGTLILLSVVASGLILTVPRLMGYEIYNIVSGSMEPEIPVGSVIYVKAEQASEIEAEEIIAFQSENSVVCHRVVENHVVEGEFVTKGDANAEEDLSEVPYEQLIGRVTHHYPMLGELMVLYTSGVGKAYIICFALCGAMMNIVAARIRERHRD